MRHYPMSLMEQLARARDQVLNPSNFPSVSIIDNISLPFSCKVCKQMEVDIKNEDKQIVVHANLPGVDKKDVSVDFKNNILTISVSKEETIKEEKDNYIHKGRSSQKSSFSWNFDEDLDEEKISAKLDNGVLTVTLPKCEEDCSSCKKIEIE